MLGVIWGSCHLTRSGLCAKLNSPMNAVMKSSAQWVEMAVELDTKTGSQYPDNPHRDLVDQVYDRMLILLQRQGLVAVETLNVVALAKELGVSRTPVNMALVRLERDGLVQKLSGGGWVTVAIARKDIEELFELREQLDTLAVRKATERATPDDICDLLSMVDEMEKAVEENAIERWLAIDHCYEKRILDMADNAILKQTRELLRGRLLRMNMTALLMSDRMSASTREHVSMTEAIASGDSDLAIKEALEHLFSMKTSLLNLYDKILQPLRGLIS